MLVSVNSNTKIIEVCVQVTSFYEEVIINLFEEII
jgi:hypothetical protein